MLGEFFVKEGEKAVDKANGVYKPPVYQRYQPKEESVDFYYFPMAGHV